VANKYLVVYRHLDRVVPRSLRTFLRSSITKAFEGLDVELDLNGTKKPRDLVVTFTKEVPGLIIFGESSRLDIDNELDAGEATVYVGGMQAYRLKMDNGLCEKAFPETDDSLGSLIANTAIHETAHMLGLNTGGHDGGGHTSDPDNFMWDPGTLPAAKPTFEPVFIYTVVKGDTLSALVQKYMRGTLDPCRFAATSLTYQRLWDLRQNKQPGFVGDPAKSGVQGHKANNPNWIYPGEKIAFPNHNLRSQDYRRNFAGLMGKKSFTGQQLATMKKFIEDRIKAGLG
jgi:hypothetical protein